MPYIDLTTLLLDIAGKKGSIEFICREEAVICGTEEVLRIFQKLNISASRYLPSGSRVSPQTSVLKAEGLAQDLHMAWKVSMNILEFASGIATRTNRIVNKAKQVNPKIEILTTRKVIPGTKELAVKAVVAGGGIPHRLGLSETVLIFKQHLNFLGGLEGLAAKVSEIKAKACEKKILVEAETVEEAVILSRMGIDGIQFDKISPSELLKAVELIKAGNKDIVLLAAGGINENNASEYAGTGVDGIVTSSIYFGKPVDFGARLEQN